MSERKEGFWWVRVGEGAPRGDADEVPEGWLVARVVAKGKAMWIPACGPLHGDPDITGMMHPLWPYWEWGPYLGTEPGEKDDNGFRWVPDGDGGWAPVYEPNIHPRAWEKLRGLTPRERPGAAMRFELTFDSTATMVEMGRLLTTAAKMGATIKGDSGGMGKASRIAIGELFGLKIGVLPKVRAP